ncbi:hypothetical protein ILYODFUR_036483 [Ilyodon furcidens]|uniref:Uncharacterized protein n=1 Tax=Ilyodon furcidens TaxID=33524 RepID=A0ABV0TGK7_9TELE
MSVLDRKKCDRDDLLQGEHVSYMPCKRMNTLGFLTFCHVTITTIIINYWDRSTQSGSELKQNEKENQLSKCEKDGMCLYLTHFTLIILNKVQCNLCSSEFT